MQSTARVDWTTVFAAQGRRSPDALTLPTVEGG
jgi:hypothetical protein